MHAIESGKTKTVKGTTLANLSRVLGATPEMILGKGLITESVLHEAEFLSMWRKLAPSQQEAVMGIVRGLLQLHASVVTAPPPRNKRANFIKNADQNIE
jgi:hypothetical protein